MSLNIGNVFDANFYRAANHDLAGLNDAQALSHFQAYGLNEGRSFSPFVDLSFYRASYSDLANFNNSQLLDHLENHGVSEGRIFSPIFDLDYYRANNSDLARLNNEQLFIHLESYGVTEGREFSRIFNVNYYKSHNSDLAAAKLTNIQLLDHFELSGLREGRESYLGYDVQTGKIQSVFPSTPSADLTYHGGKTIPNLNFYNLYLGGSQSWFQSDIDNINNSLSQAMSDPRLNSIVSQYFPGQQVTSNFLGSGIVEASVPTTVSQDYIETLLTKVGNQGGFNGFNLSSTVFDFMLPQYTTLSMGKDDSLGGLGGYHGSINFQGADGKVSTAYYAIGVYSENYSYLGVQNGIAVFNPSWQNVVATIYHELNEARTDPDVGESNRTGNRKLLGWYSDKVGVGEVGDYPITEASQLGSNNLAFWYEPLVNGQGRVPVQLLYSNAVHGPEDPTTIQIT